MRYRWRISSDGGDFWTEVTPLNGSKLRLDRTRDLSAGQVFFRRKLGQAVELGGDDYLLLDAFRRRPSLRCTELLMVCEAQCGGWKEQWRGRFSAGSCRWDLGGCTVSVKPETVDRYTCLLSRKDEKRNILQAGTVNASAAVIPSIEWTACVFKVFTITPPVYHTACADGIVHTDPGTAPSDWWSAFGYPINPPNETLQIYWREFQITECVGGNPVPPIGSGWTLLDNNCATDGTAKYIREPLISFAFDVQAGTCDADGNAVPPAVDCEQPWTQLTPCGLVVDGTEYPPYFICYAPEQQEMNRARTMESVVELLLDQSGCDLEGARSDFFEWSPLGDAPGYVAGFNYVTGLVNEVNALCILQKTDAIDPDATNPATIGEITFAELMEFFRVAFRCFWDIDDDGYLRIEHWSYWRYAVGLDLNEQQGTVEPLVFESLGDEIPRIERAVWMEAQGRDFIGKDILYDSPCAIGPPKEWNPGRFTTDIGYVITEPDAISKDGFMVLATKLVSGVYQTIIAPGAITSNVVSNAPLSWANLEEAFWQADRYLASAVINGTRRDFDDFLPTVKQEEASYRACCSSLDFDPRQKIAGALSRRLGINADVESESLDLYADRSTLILRYAY